MPCIEAFTAGRTPTARAQNIPYGATDMLSLGVVEPANVVDDCPVDRRHCGLMQTGTSFHFCDAVGPGDQIDNDPAL